ncbi:cobalamin-5'-phosphate synthase [Nocardioides scoriae]|uniref:Adenosylcobinamide-GDP ribazoletransferase n=1 Tax=Nocardioides scoriae TaxID=642780 RepID=A0A1H1P1C3_9ACTN|nr:adenosylcobinamide-GDP ribazoletransferase [Nocardioides scoriae]SDS04983.1 cobalamin-5'-phosphate synthase [Nocardioides scoriae]
MLSDAWRLAVGTLTVVRVRPPVTVDRRTAGAAVLLAPLAVLPLGVGVAVVLELGDRLSAPPLVAGLLAVAVLVLGTRALHVDGLSDTADGLTASYDRERSLAVMHSGTSGPAGGVAVLLVLGVQAAAFASLVLPSRGPVLAGVLVCLSRCALALACARGVPAARPDGLGTTFAGSVGRPAAVGTWLAALVVAALVAGWVGPGPLVLRAAAGVLLAAGVVLLVVRRATHRLGGVTGDVLGAAVELCLAALLVGVAGAATVVLAG